MRGRAPEQAEVAGTDFNAEIAELAEFSLEIFRVLSVLRVQTVSACSAGSAPGGRAGLRGRTAGARDRHAEADHQPENDHENALGACDGQGAGGSQQRNDGQLVHFPRQSAPARKTAAPRSRDDMNGQGSPSVVGRGSYDRASRRPATVFVSPAGYVNDL